MIEDYLPALVQLAVRITELDRLESEVTDKREWQAGKDEYEASEEQFNKLRGELIDGLLAPGNPRENAVGDVERELSTLRAQADPSWHPAIDYTRDNVMPLLTKEAGRSPGIRKARKMAPLIAVGLAVIAYFGIRLFGGVTVDQDIESREGIQQRAAAAGKVIRYEEWMSTHVRRGGFLKGILLWPIEPTDLEIKAAAEFAGLVLEAQSASGECAAVAGSGDRLTDAQMNLIDDVADYIRSGSVVWQDPPVMTVVGGLQRADSC